MSHSTADAPLPIASLMPTSRLAVSDFCEGLDDGRACVRSLQTKT
jgi:hypothetical protein